MNTFAAAVSVHPVAPYAVGSIIGDVLEQIGSHPDLAVLLVTRHFAGTLEDVVATVNATLQPTNLVGLTVNGLIANGSEIEEGPAMMLWAGATGPCSVELVERGQRINGRSVHGPEFSVEMGLLLGDANSFADYRWDDNPGDTFVGGMDRARRHEPIVVVANGRLQQGGAVSIRFTDAIVRRSFVSVGTLGVGPVFQVTKAERSTLYELSGAPALDRMREALRGVDDPERTLAKFGVHIGIASDYPAGDAHPSEDANSEGSLWTIRRLLGMDRTQRALSVDGDVKEGDLVQFRLRAPAIASEELDRLVAEHFGMYPVEGALCFVSAARGKEFFGEEHHDAKLIHDATRIPMAGMFCEAELAPIGGRASSHTDSCTVLTFSRPMPGLR